MDLQFAHFNSLQISLLYSFGCLATCFEPHSWQVRMCASAGNLGYLSIMLPLYRMLFTIANCVVNNYGISRMIAFRCIPRSFERVKNMLARRARANFKNGIHSHACKITAAYTAKCYWNRKWKVGRKLTGNRPPAGHMRSPAGRSVG
jgi:hypothetical protein